MKKILTGLAFVATFASLSSADITRFEMGIGGWSYTPKGTISYTDGITTGTYASLEKDNSSAYIWMLIKHPLPILPNLRLEYVNIQDDGIIKGSFKDFTTIGISTTGSIEMTQYDVIPYYNLIDNTMYTTIDLGLDVKVIDLNYKANGVNVNGLGTGNYDDSQWLAIPMLYLRGRVELPFQLGVETDMKYITYDGSTIYDFRAKVDYTFDLGGVNPGIELGYRAQKFDIDYKNGSERTVMNMDFTGFYAGAMLRF